MIDEQGFRANVGIVLVNDKKCVFWGRRIGQSAWQFPQGGVHDDETLEATLYRELAEEIGLQQTDVVVLGCTKDWLYYRIPENMQRKYRKPICIGQKQKWYLLQLQCPEQKLRLDLSDSPEFDSWCWVDYWYPVNHVIKFKRNVYQRVLNEFAPLVFK